ncbi:AMP-binding protein [Undibacterium sp.]|jgi:acyl-coenzyme A synthetase/AMP-(fatty) acid ligase|uniref:AMP-binding protein n=1 Tax=Undibacterium sp. TaxID=1914977 RepID=UPI002BC3D69F|nr:AMP-binding protein [Undibacterium sp.]HTD06380.1 AMP-binding protein [Undibacterium sp.]
MMSALSLQTLPLIRHFPPGTPLALRDEPVSPQQFIALAHKLAEQFPDCRHVINLCDDRYYFLLAFAAALIANRITLTPSSRATEAIARIQRDFSDTHVITDQVLAAHLEHLAACHPAGLPTSGDLHIPEIPADQAAVILFTSGSTGQPSAHLKTWGMLVQGADQLQHAFGVPPGSCIVGTIPPQHMFGLESTIVFPLQWGCTIHRARPLLPADIEHAAEMASAPVWLMTTPVHLRALISEEQALCGIAGAISATSAIDQPSATAVEKILNSPLYEIYGCTEAGITATRRPAKGLEWKLCPDFQLRVEGEQGWLEGPRVTQTLALTDYIEMHGADRFTLHGRTGSILKVAGRRTSLDALNAELLAIDGVIDGCFYLPASAQENQRLHAFVVAPQLDARDVMNELKKRIDSVFLPRPLWKVQHLPRDSNGKLPHSALSNLAGSMAASGAAPAPCLSSVVSEDHIALDGHFPGRPIVPGVLLLSQVIELATGSYHVSGVKQVKFHAPLSPGQTYEIKLSQASPTSVKFTIQHNQSTIATGLLQCEAQHV